MPVSIPYINFGGQGELLHFAHANAYPPGCYRQFLSAISEQYHPIAIKHRPLWPGHSPNEMRTWRLLAEDLIRFLDQRELRQIIGMGHSLGGVITLMAAQQRPDLFRALVLIEPVMLSTPLLFFLGLLPLSLRKRWIPIAKQALRRHQYWPDQQAMFEHFRSKKVFRRFSDEALWDYVRAGSQPAAKGGITLTYSREWEAQVYCHAPLYRRLRHQIKIPTLSIRGAATDAIAPKEWALWQRSGNAELITMEKAGHLVPMERPKALASLILHWLADTEK